MAHPNPGANQGIGLAMPPYNMPLVDKNTGAMTTAWQGWFQVLFNRVGGLSATPNGALPSTTGPQSNIGSYIVNSQIIAAGVNTNMYTSPGGLQTIIDSFSVTNNSKAAVSLSVYLVPANGAPTNTGASANLVLSPQSIAAGASVPLTILNGYILSGGGSIYCLATAANALLIQVSGRQAAP